MLEIDDRELYPGCPPNREQAIAEFACLTYSGREGRIASAKQLDDEAGGRPRTTRGDRL